MVKEKAIVIEGVSHLYFNKGKEIVVAVSSNVKKARKAPI
jgi:hypothetical protein